jgi:hypothetical protein
MLLYSTKISGYRGGKIWYPARAGFETAARQTDARRSFLSKSSMVGLAGDPAQDSMDEIRSRFVSRPEKTAGNLIEMLSNPWLKQNAGNILVDLSAEKKDLIVKCLAGSLSEKLYGREAADVLYRIALDDPLAVIRPVAASLATPSYRTEASKLLLAVSNFEPDFVARKLISCLSDPCRKSVASGLLKQMSELSPYHRTVIGSKMTGFIVEDDLFPHIRSILKDIWTDAPEYNPHARSIGEYMFPMIEPFGKALCSERKRAAAVKMLSELGRTFPQPIRRFASHLIKINADDAVVCSAACKVISSLDRILGQV